ncbi:MAG: heterodisulfide reductase subunit B, partial [Acidithiobacillus sp.]
EDLVEKMGISWDKAKADFQEYLKQVEQGNVEYLYNPELATNQNINMKQA